MLKNSTNWHLLQPPTCCIAGRWSIFHGTGLLEDSSGHRLTVYNTWFGRSYWSRLLLGVADYFWKYIFILFPLFTHTCMSDLTNRSGINACANSSLSFHGDYLEDTILLSLHLKRDGFWGERRRVWGGNTDHNLATLMVVVMVDGGALVHLSVTFPDVEKRGVVARIRDQFLLWSPKFPSHPWKCCPGYVWWHPSNGKYA